MRCRPGIGWKQMAHATEARGSLPLAEIVPGCRQNLYYTKLGRRTWRPAERGASCYFGELTRAKIMISTIDVNTEANTFTELKSASLAMMPANS